MIYDWYKVFNKTEFEALDLVSKTYNVFLEGIGQKEILVTLGNELGMVYEDTFLMVDFGEENPWAISPYAVYRDEETQDVYLGIESEDQEA